MTKRHDDTSMGGLDGSFAKTPWGQIVGARTGAKGRRRALLEDLLRRYWKPVYCYLRRKGHENEPAKDLAQGFFHEVVLGRNLIGRADPAQGRFRTFLLAALDHYLAGVHRAQTAKKRRPAGGVLRLDGGDLGDVPPPCKSLTPEEAFHHVWASTLLDGVLKTVEAMCHQNGQEMHWQLFRARVVRPIMENARPPSLKVLCARHGVADAVRASSMILTVKRRFQVVLRREVRQFVGSDAEVDGEIRELIGIVSRS